MLAAWFGLRRGEIVGLKWDSIDLKKKTLEIEGTIIDQGKNGCKVKYKKGAKTTASLRSFPLTDKQVAYFNDLKERQALMRIAPGYCHDWKKYVCVYHNGKLIQPNTLSHVVPKVCEDCGLPRLKLHELRHTNISLIIQNGFSLVDASKWAGHRNVSTTGNIYAHVDDKSKEKISATLTKLLA